MSVFIRSEKRSQGRRNSVPKSGFTGYWLSKTRTSCETRPRSAGAASFHATLWTVYDVLVASKKTVRPMKTEDRRVCPSCGNEFSGAVEFCPVCMLHGALAEDVESGESSPERVFKPKSQSAARRFQHYELLAGEDGRPVELGRGSMGGNL